MDQKYLEFGIIIQYFSRIKDVQFKKKTGWGENYLNNKTEFCMIFHPLIWNKY